MNKLLIALFFVAVVYGSTIDDEPSFVQKAGDSNEACDIQLIKQFKRFKFDHKLTHKNISRGGKVTNYVDQYMKVAPPKTYNKACYKYYRTGFHYFNNRRYHSLTKRSDKKKNPIIQNKRGGLRLYQNHHYKEWAFKLQDLPLMSIRGVKVVKGTKYNIVQYRVTLKNERNQRIRTHIFRHWVSIDHAWGEFNPDETGDDYKIVKTRIYHTSERCDGEDCLIRINLTTRLICYKDTGYKRRIVKSTKLWVSQYIYCELAFTDPSIKKFLNLVSVVIKGDGGKDNEIIRSGWYTAGRQFRGKSRFRVLVYWPERVIVVKVNARVTHTMQKCKKHCVECGKKGCYHCVRGLLAQGHGCVKRCGKGHFQKGKTHCKACERHCSKCSSKTACTKCFVPRYLYAQNCVRTCPKGMGPKNGYCIKKPNPVLKYYGRIFKNVNRNSFIRAKFWTIYDYAFGYAMRKTHFDAVRRRCDSNDWIAVLGCDDRNNRHVLAGAMDNCRYALVLRSYKRGWNSIYRRNGSTVYWFNAHNLCMGFSHYSRIHFNICHSTGIKKYLPVLQIHINHWGYAIGREINNKNRKVIMILKR